MVGEHQLLEVAGEDGRVLAGFGADGGYLALGVALVDSGAQRTAVLIYTFYIIR